MTLVEAIVNRTIRGLTGVACRIDARGLDKIPTHGPLIIVANHINFIEIPILYTRLWPRPVYGFAKAETWDNPLMARLFDIWKAIPIKRGEADLAAMRKGLSLLKERSILAIAPEGTRSGDGQLGKAHPGVVVLALRSKAPLLPVVYYGGEGFRDHISRLKRTPFSIRVGKPFTLETNGEPVTGELRAQILDEIMYNMASLLPPQYRGHYAHLENATQRYLRFIPSILSDN